MPLNDPGEDGRAGGGAYLDVAVDALHAEFAAPVMRDWLARCLPAARAAWAGDGRVPAWLEALRVLPAAPVGEVDLVTRVHIGAAAGWSAPQREALVAGLMQLCPWRKGPFDLLGVHIDAEWRSDRKWKRIAPHLRALRGRRVLDVGCGNGYYAWRMAGAGARCVLGLDPAMLCIVQYLALRRYLAAPPVFLLPLGSAALDADLGVFDTAFSLGVLYHRREPLQHLRELRRALRSGGELVLETLIVDDAVAAILMPAGRYAAMNNVWAIPAPSTVARWLADSGFGQVRCVDVTRTTPQEQRTTVWMPQHSLADFLDPGDPARTIEGHPAPTRAIFIAVAQ